MTWRTGTKLGCTLYRDEVFVGTVDTTELAEEIVRTMNGAMASVCTGGLWTVRDEGDGHLTDICQSCGKGRDAHATCPSEAPTCAMAGCRTSLDPADYQANLCREHRGGSQRTNEALPELPDALKALNCLVGLARGRDYSDENEIRRHEQYIANALEHPQRTDKAKTDELAVLRRLAAVVREYRDGLDGPSGEASPKAMRDVLSELDQWTETALLEKKGE